MKTPPKIELLSKKNCLACERVRYFLRSLNLQWKEREVDDRTVPVLKIDNRILRPPISYNSIIEALKCMR